MLKAFAETLAIGIVFGVFLIGLSRGAQKNFYLREGIAVVSLGWILSAIIAALPFWLSGEVPSFADAYFEAMSGLTTTGATVLSGLDSRPRGLLFWRSFIQWVGGMGIIVLFVAVLPALGVSGKFLYRLEVPGVSKEGVKPQIQDAASILWRIYIVFTVVLTLLLLACGMNFFDAICHTFTTLATGGYSTHDASIGYFNSWLIEFVLLVFMFLAGINFSLYYFLLRGQKSRVWRDPEFRTYIAITLIATAFLSIVLGVGYYMNDSFPPGLNALEKITLGFRYASFQAVSIMTTTGFGTTDFNLWPAVAKLLLIGLMFCGACAGSTGGGMKVFRLTVALKSVIMGIRQFFRPRMVDRIRLGNQAITDEVHASILGFFLTFISIFFICSMLLASMGIDMITATSAVISAMGNVGPGLGRVGPTETYAFLPGLGKYLLSFCMMLGRLELYTALAIFVPSFWLKN